MHYLIHLPHSGVIIPEEFVGDYLISESELQKNIYEYCDIYTDELFASMLTRFGGVKSLYSRLFFDPERFGDDREERMHQEYRLGWFYENAIIEKKPLRRENNKKLIRNFFDKHHLLLNTLTEEKLNQFGKCTVIDCHSFSNTRYWFHDQDLQLPDICIGFEDMHVDEALVQIIKEEFKAYRVEVNKPYAGSLVPTNYWGKDSRVKSVMIEINKKLYLQEDNRSKSEGFYLLQQKLDNILEKLL